MHSCPARHTQKGQQRGLKRRGPSFIATFLSMRNAANDKKWSDQKKRQKGEEEVEEAEGGRGSRLIIIFRLWAWRFHCDSNKSERDRDQNLVTWIPFEGEKIDDCKSCADGINFAKRWGWTVEPTHHFVWRGGEGGVFWGCGGDDDVMCTKSFDAWTIAVLHLTLSSLSWFLFLHCICRTRS